MSVWSIMHLIPDALISVSLMVLFRTQRGAFSRYVSVTIVVTKTWILVNKIQVQQAVKYLDHIRSKQVSTFNVSPTFVMMLVMNNLFNCRSVTLAEIIAVSSYQVHNILNRWSNYDPSCYVLVTTYGMLQWNSSFRGVSGYNPLNKY